MGEKIETLVHQGKEGQIAALLMVLHKLGGWVVLALAALAALWIVWNASQSSNRELITELRAQRDQTREIIVQNSVVLERVATALKN